MEVLKVISCGFHEAAAGSFYTRCHLPPCNYTVYFTYNNERFLVDQALYCVIDQLYYAIVAVGDAFVLTDSSVLTLWSRADRR